MSMLVFVALAYWNASLSACRIERCLLVLPFDRKRN